MRVVVSIVLLNIQGFNMTSPLLILTPILIYGFILVLVIIFVVSHKRLAAAHKELADAHKEIAKQLASIAIELRHKDSK